MVDANTLTIAAVGDITIDRERPETALVHVRNAMQASSLSFANFEGAFSDKCDPIPGAKLAVTVPPANAVGLAGIDVVALANNHVLDAGFGGLRTTIDAIQALGACTIGAGLDEEAAWKPAIKQVGTERIGFLSFAAVFPQGWNATGSIGGIACIRSADYYAARHPLDFAPGQQPRTITVMVESDWQKMERSIAALRDKVDRIVVSAHWGDYSRPYVITRFEREAARRLARAGVDLIIGHHHHCLRGGEFLENTPVLYGLGNLVFDFPRYPEQLRMQGVNWLHLDQHQLEARFGKFAIFPRAGGFPFNQLARWTTMAFVSFGERGRIPQVFLVPLWIQEDDGTPIVLDRGTAKYKAWLQFMERCHEDGELPSTVIDEGQTLNGLPVVRIIPCDARDGRKQ
jgi:hypothetical protein